eukprot:TRINITY_DN14978_c0_g1_i3.p1 TRINITY_DN14978_c0_g1~~TRINITY_DN14978_c0_g1_i3.p1  ORF type:complete len:262 (-),score=28.68 TRINITY_DN14978_c0_g1_i3:299-1048(-)
MASFSVLPSTRSRRGMPRSARGTAFLVAASLAPVAGKAQILSHGTLPSQCAEFATCSLAGGGNGVVDWANFHALFSEAREKETEDPQVAMEAYFRLMDIYTLDAGVALRCRLGSAAVFYRLAQRYLALGFSQRAANLFQLAMSMVWDTTKQQHGMECLQYELWGVRWLEEFMERFCTRLRSAWLHADGSRQPGGRADGRRCQRNQLRQPLPTGGRGRRSDFLQRASASGQWWFRWPSHAKNVRTRDGSC